MGSKGDDFGDRMKAYEAHETGRRFLPMLPVYARLDGRSFSRFTKGMNRPYDERFTRAMVETTKYLLGETHARIGYTQSDETSLVWLSETYDGEIFFAGKVMKMASVLASIATAKFGSLIATSADGLAPYATRLPAFDCRVYQLPNKIEAANAFLWREKDATKNAVSMAARAYYSHKQLHEKSSADMQEMLYQKGINFNDYPPFFKRGTFVRREGRFVTLDAETLARIPEQHRPLNGEAWRTVHIELEMPSFSKVTNRVDVIFSGCYPETAEEPKGGVDG